MVCLFENEVVENYSVKFDHVKIRNPSTTHIHSLQQTKTIMK